LIVNNFNDCVFYIFIFSHKLDLFQATYSIIVIWKISCLNVFVFAMLYQFILASKSLIYKHYSVFRYSIGDKEKSFITHVNVLRLFFLSLTYLENKLVCLSVPCFISLYSLQSLWFTNTIAYFDIVSVIKKKVL
jgi:hypothetical protein